MKSKRARPHTQRNTVIQKKRHAVRSHARSKTGRSGRRNQSTTSERQAETHARALRALRRMRKGASMSAATRAEHIKPATFCRHVGRTVQRNTPSGRFRVAAADKLARTFQVRTEDGELVRVPVPTLKAARELSTYENAVAHFLRTGDPSQLDRFAGKTVVTDDGRRITLPTDPDRLRELAAADLLRLDSLYAPITSRP